MKRRWFWPWTRPDRSGLEDAEQAVTRASEDAAVLEEKWREVRGVRRRADLAAERVDRVYERNGFSHLFWTDMTKDR